MTTKQLVPSFTLTLFGCPILWCSFDKDNPTTLTLFGCPILWCSIVKDTPAKPVTKLKGAPPTMKPVTKLKRTPPTKRQLHLCGCPIMCCSIDKDTPKKPVTKLKGAPPRSKRQLQLMAAMVLLAKATGAGRVFHTRTELQLKHQIQQFRACNGVLDTSHIHGTKLTSLQNSKVATDKIFDTATNNSEFACTAVADSGCSETCANNLQDFTPGTMWKLEVPIALGGIAGSLLVTHASMVHWETIDDFGEVVEIKTVAFYHPDLPGRLFSPQSYFHREHKGEDIELADSR